MFKLLLTSTIILTSTPILTNTEIDEIYKNCHNSQILTKEEFNKKNKSDGLTTNVVRNSTGPNVRINEKKLKTNNTEENKEADPKQTENISQNTETQPENITVNEQIQEQNIQDVVEQQEQVENAQVESIIEYIPEEISYELQEPEIIEEAVSYVEPITQVQPQSYGGYEFDGNGLLVMESSPNAQQVINLLFQIPGAANGAHYHSSLGIDSLIDTLSTREALWVLHRIEGPGFGQTADGFAGVDSPQTHQALITNQLNRRFGGSIHSLLKSWGTFSYGGY